MLRFLLRFFLVLATFSPLACSDKTIVEEIPTAASEARDAFYLGEVKPLLDARCVSCHACSSAPCQLNLADHEGIRRGASKELLYNGTRILEAKPTRLGIDAHTLPEWSQLGFFPVADGGDQSILLQSIHQRRVNAGDPKVVSKNSNQCPSTSDDLKSLYKSRPEAGMPYGFPPLDDSQTAVFSRWLQEGYPALSPSARSVLARLSGKEQSEVEKWEELLNQNDPKSQLIGRYLYEHLFSGMIEFSDASQNLFRIVRSETAAPNPVIPVKARRPYDPAGKTYYRFQKITSTLAHKNLFVYTLDDKRVARFRELFYDSNWTISAKDLPAYDEETGANPFLIFKAMPEKSRYQFFLDDTHYFASAFIKGVVCEGNIAVNVINEKFFVFFVDPESRFNQVDKIISEKMTGDLEVPGVGGYLASFYPVYKKEQMEFVAGKQKLLDKQYPEGLKLTDLWDGDGHNPQAALTIYRHQDNSYVVPGIVGEVPKTVWVIDYTIFERLYYLLAAGFDVYGHVGHQASTRLYMDNLRVESEDLFLSFLPAADRKSLRNAWYRGSLAKKKMDWLNPFGGVTASSQISYQSKDRKKEFVEKVLNERFEAKVKGQAKLESCCGSGDDEAVKVLKGLTEAQGGFIRTFPELSLLSVASADGSGIKVYSLIHHRGYRNVAFMLDEDDRLVPNEDLLSIQEGIHGSFPNFIFHVKAEELNEFVKAGRALTDRKSKSFAEFIKTYGVRRSSPEFWARYDAIQKWFEKDAGNRSGVLDLSKYEFL